MMNIIAIVILLMMCLYGILCTSVQTLYQIKHKEFSHPFSLAGFGIKEKTSKDELSGIFVNIICFITFCIFPVFIFMDFGWIKIFMCLMCFIVFLTFSLSDFLDSYHTAENHICKAIHKNILNFIFDILLFGGSIFFLITAIGLIF